MADYPDKMRIKTALPEKKTKMQLGCDHISTSNFLQCNPCYIKEMVPKEEIKIDMTCFSRMQPLPVPTLGRMKFNNRCFFVPMRTIYPAWNDFIVDTQHTFSDANSNPSLIATVPTISNGDLAKTMKSNTFATTSGATSAATQHDFVHCTTGGTKTYYKYTPAGRQALKVLESLGYKVNYYDGDTTQYSLLPLFAFIKVYLDWYFPSAYVQDVRYTNLEKFLKYDSTSTIPFTSQDLEDALSLTSFVNYDSDYFVSAWDKPSMPNSNASSIITLNDITNGTSTTYNRFISTNNNASIGDGNTPILVGNNGSAALNAISDYAMDALYALTDYSKRHQLVGARALDRMAARFGVTLPSEKLNRSLYLGVDDFVMNIGDVMSNSETSGANLGDFAGKGLGAGNHHFEFDTNEYGYLIIVSSLVPVAGYVQGVDRMVMRTTKLDFYTPEFDMLGTQPIRAKELYVGDDGSNGTSTGNSYTQVFGYAPRYADYKVAKDRLTGNFRIATLNGGQEGCSSWHLNRMFDGTDSFSGSVSNMVHNIGFVRGLDKDQYSRIFYNTQDPSDKFTIIYHFDIEDYAPMKPLYETYEFHTDTGKEMTMDVNGVKMN